MNTATARRRAFEDDWEPEGDLLDDFAKWPDEFVYDEDGLEIGMDVPDEDDEFNNEEY